jgi:hypothetical protein
VAEADDINRCERELLNLSAVFDEPVKNTDYALALVSLGLRARTLFRATLVLRSEGLPVVARLLLRPMGELNVCVRFLRKDPDLHTELWYAEGDRDVLAIVTEQRASRTMRKRWGPAKLSPEALSQREEHVRKARARALEAKIPGIEEKKGQVLPGIAQQVQMLKDPAASEAYTLAYRLQSGDIHSGARSVQGGPRELRNDATVSLRDEIEGEGLGIRVLAACMFASTLELLAAELKLPGEEEARQIRRTFVPDTIPDEQRLDTLSREGDRD